MSATMTQPDTTTDHADEDAIAQAQLDAEVKSLAEMAEAQPGEDWKPLLARRCHLMAEACGTNPLTGRRLYSAADFLGEVERAVNLGAGIPRTGPSVVAKLARHELVPNLRLRERVEHLQAEKGLTTYALALRLGITESRSRKDGSYERGDTVRVERLLGMQTRPASGGMTSLQLFVSYELAVAFADALGLDYHELGV